MLTEPPEPRTIPWPGWLIPVEELHDMLMAGDLHDRRWEIVGGYYEDGPRWLPVLDAMLATDGGWFAVVSRDPVFGPRRRCGRSSRPGRRVVLRPFQSVAVIRPVGEPPAWLAEKPLIESPAYLAAWRKEPLV